MSMHIEGPWLTSINTKKRAEKMTKSQRDELERNWRDRNRRLKEIGLPKQTFEEFLDFVNGKKEEKKNQLFFKNKKIEGKEVTSPFYTGLPDLSYRTQGRAASDDTKTAYTVPLEISRPDIWVKGTTSSKSSPTYTGSKVVGIGTMHKSNMVPIFSDEEAKDISKMRR